MCHLAVEHIETEILTSDNWVKVQTPGTRQRDGTPPDVLCP